MEYVGRFKLKINVWLTKALYFGGITQTRTHGTTQSLCVCWNYIKLHQQFGLAFHYSHNISNHHHQSILFKHNMSFSHDLTTEGEGSNLHRKIKTYLYSKSGREKKKKAPGLQSQTPRLRSSYCDCVIGLPQTETLFLFTHPHTGSTGSAVGIPVDSCTCIHPPGSDSHADTGGCRRTRPYLSAAQ